MIQLKQDTLNGKTIAYHSESIFEIQIGRFSKGKYRTRYRIKGSLPSALLHYQGINIGNGYKKRLVCWTLNKPLLIKHA